MREMGSSRSRVVRAPPPRALRAGDGRSLPALDVCRESPEPIGMLLWRSLRNVQLWADVPHAERGGLFAEGARDRRLEELRAGSLPEALEEPMATLAELLGAPQQIEPMRVAEACERIALWAGEARPETALEFAQAAALVCPDDARLCWQAGLRARDRGRAESAELWLVRAIVLSRQLGDWPMYVTAHLAMAKLRLQRGTVAGARRHLRFALNRARRHHLHLLRARVLHAQLAIEAESGHGEAVERCAAEALDAYREAPAERDELAFDVAWSWMDRGHFAEAGAVFARLVGSLEPRAGAHLAGARARCAGALGDRVTFEAARRTLERHQDGPGVAQAWANVAAGALALGARGEARRAAERARALAARRAEHRVVLLADSLRTQCTELSPRLDGTPLRPSPEDAASPARRALAERLVEALTPAAPQPTTAPTGQPIIAETSGRRSSRLSRER